MCIGKSVVKSVCLFACLCVCLFDRTFVCLSFFVSVFDSLIVVKWMCVCLVVYWFLLVSSFSFLLVYKAVWIFEYLFFSVSKAV